MATIRKMQSKNPATTATGTISTAIAPNGPGSLIVVFAGNASTGATLNISDTASHAWTTLAGPQVGATDVSKSWWTISTTSTPFTITVTASATFLNLLVDEFVGVDVTSPVADAHSAIGTGVAPTVTSPTVTPTRNRSLIWGACNDTLTAAGTGFTVGANDSAGDLSVWAVLGDSTAGVATSALFGTVSGGDYNLSVAAFNPAPGPDFNFVKRQTRPAMFRPGLAR